MWRIAQQFVYFHIEKVFWPFIHGFVVSVCNWSLIGVRYYWLIVCKCFRTLIIVTMSRNVTSIQSNNTFNNVTSVCVLERTFSNVSVIFACCWFFFIPLSFVILPWWLIILIIIATASRKLWCCSNILVVVSAVHKRTGRTFQRLLGSAEWWWRDNRRRMGTHLRVR